MMKAGFFRKCVHVYDEFYNGYNCPHDKLLRYATTNRKGYKFYKSNPKDCEICFLSSRWIKLRISATQLALKQSMISARKRLSDCLGRQKNSTRCVIRIKLGYKICKLKSGLLWHALISDGIIKLTKKIKNLLLDFKSLYFRGHIKETLIICSNSSNSTNWTEKDKPTKKIRWVYL